MNSGGYPDYNINGLIPFNSGTPDQNGTYWFMEGEIGGWDSPDGRVTMLPKIGKDATADGEYPADQHYRGRSLTFTIRAECLSEIERQAAGYLLAQALDLVDKTGIFYANEYVPKTMVISRSGNNNQGKLMMSMESFAQKSSMMEFSRTVTDGVLASDTTVTSASANFGELDTGVAIAGPGIPAGTTIVTVHSPTDITISAAATATGDDVALEIGGHVGWPVGTQVWLLRCDVEIYATDPRKYGAQQEEPFEEDSASISNPGNTSTMNMVTTIYVTGGGDGPFTIEAGGNTMVLKVPAVPSGAPALSPIPVGLIVDSYNKTITDADGNNYYYLRDLSTPWPQLLPGDSDVVITGAGGSDIPGKVDFYPAWI